MLSAAYAEKAQPGPVGSLKLASTIAIAAGNRYYADASERPRLNVPSDCEQSMVEVDRNIHFFRAIVSGEDDGTQPAFDYAAVLAKLASVPTPSRYVEERGGYLFGHPPEANDRVIFWRSRRMGLPQVDENGVFSPLNIPTTSGLAEITHVRFFPNNLIGAEFNFHGPRVSALAAYLRRLCKPPCPRVVFAPLLSETALEQLDELETISCATVRVARPYVASLEAASPSLRASLQQAMEVGNAQDFELILRPEKYSRGSLNVGEIGRVWRRLRSLNDHQGVVGALKIEGTADGQRRIIDLLSDRLIVTRQVVQADERTRAISADSAFAAIEDAYDSVREAALVAPAIGFGVTGDVDDA